MVSFSFVISTIPPLRLMFSRSQHHVTAEVFSSSSSVPVLTCSTKEWAVKRELASTHSVAACQAVGEVLALRCQQAGITRMVYWAIPWTYRSDAVSTRCWDRWVNIGVGILYFTYIFILSCRFRLSERRWKREESFSVNPGGSIWSHEPAHHVLHIPMFIL